MEQSNCIENCSYCVSVTVSVMYKCRLDLIFIIECNGLYTKLIGAGRNGPVGLFVNFF